ncbi:MAG: DUF4440 domain-containing protein [Bacteroidetes bacterium]|nr:DUF4440 domain-containing protein [Bacteroidota bacterium]
MKKIVSSLLFIFLISKTFSQTADELAIKKVLENQVNAWNRGSIDDFMKAYWQNDSLTFIGHGGITHGYNPTLNNYKKNYNDTAKMGKLSYELLSFKKISAEYFFVTGKWSLKRSIGDIGGIYTLLFRKIKSKWVIVTDHTS